MSNKYGLSYILFFLQLYKTRLEIASQRASIDPSWNSALAVLKAVSHKAMSDDETDEERSNSRQKVVRRVDKPWASVAFKNMVNSIDGYYSRYNLDGSEKPGLLFKFNCYIVIFIYILGPNPRDRLTTLIASNNAYAPKRLPRNCYHELYLGNLSQYEFKKLNSKRDILYRTWSVASLIAYNTC